MTAREANGVVQTEFKSMYDRLIARASEGCECDDGDMSDEGGCGGKCDPGMVEEAAREIDTLNRVICNLRMLAHKIATTRSDIKRRKMRHDVERIASEVGLQSSILRTPRSWRIG